MSNFSRSFTNPGNIMNLKSGSGFLCKLWDDHISQGKGFLAFRNGYASFYVEGVPLVYFFSDRDEFKVVPRLLPITRSIEKPRKNASGPVSERIWKETVNSSIGFQDVAIEILENVHKDSRPECAQVSKLYKYSSFGNSDSSFVLIDIEAAFKEKKNNEIESEINNNFKEKDNRVDMVFYDLDSESLFFFEVKRLNDERLFNKEIYDQMSGYRKLIKDEEEKIKKEYESTISFFAQLEGSRLKEATISSIHLALVITEYTSDEEKTVNLMKKTFNKDFHTVSIGDFKNVTSNTLSSWKKQILR